MEEAQFEIIRRLVRANAVKALMEEHFGDYLKSQNATSAMPEEYVGAITAAYMEGLGEEFPALLGKPEFSVLDFIGLLSLTARVNGGLQVGVAFTPKCDLPPYFFPVLIGGVKQAATLLAEDAGKEITDKVEQAFGVLHDLAHTAAPDMDVVTFCNMANERYKSQEALAADNVRVEPTEDLETYDLKADNIVLQLAINQFSMLFSTHEEIAERGEQV